MSGFRDVAGRRPVRGTLRLQALEDRTVPSGPSSLLVAAADAGGGPHVRVFQRSGALHFEFLAYDPAFTGGVRVAAGDVNGDGIDDIITAPGPGGGPHVKVFDGQTRALLREWMAYDPAFTGGVSVAAADMTGDGFADIVTGAGVGGGPHVKVFDGVTGKLVREFLAYEPDFRGGVNVAAGDIEATGQADIVTAPGPGGGPLVKVFAGPSGVLARSFFAYDPAFRGGLSVAVGQLTDDAHADIVTAPGPGGGPHVRVFDGQSGSVVREFLAYAPSFRGGVRVAAADADGDGRDEIITGPGPGGGPEVRTWSGATGELLLDTPAFDPRFLGGVYVGGCAPVVSSAAVTRTFDFGQGDQGWQAGFADFSGDPSGYQLDAGVRTLPAEIGPGTGYMIQGFNHSDDLFMFLKCKLTTADGVGVNQPYRVRFRLGFGSNAPSGAGGIGGAPGESVFLKAGAGAVEPQVVQTDNRPLNADKGNQGVGGRYASILGDIANGEPPASGDQPYVSLTRNGTMTFAARSDADGNLWLLAGTDSGFEGFTRLYYQRITVTLLPFASA